MTFARVKMREKMRHKDVWIYDGGSEKSFRSGKPFGKEPLGRLDEKCENGL
jgi:hypothetical protein